MGKWMSEEKSPEDGAASTPAGAAKKLIWFGAGSALWIVASMAYGLHLGAPDAANTLGDFLAGVFAPAAFAMLFAAVWIQSDELREQRKELILTRREFEYNREVMKAQAEEAKKQAEFIGEQTNLLAEDNERARRELARSDITDWIEQLYSFTASIWNDRYDVLLRGNAHLLDLEGIAFLRELCFRVISRCSEQPGWIGKVEAARGHFEVFLASFEHIHRIASSAEQAPRAAYVASLVRPAIAALTDEYAKVR